MNKQLNQNIRNDITLTIQQNNGSYNTRALISLLAKRYQTSKQRISGNISFMVKKLKSHHITTIISKKESDIH